MDILWGIMWDDTIAYFPSFHILTDSNDLAGGIKERNQTWSATNVWSALAIGIIEGIREIVDVPSVVSCSNDQVGFL